MSTAIEQPHCESCSCVELETFAPNLHNAAATRNPINGEFYGWCICGWRGKHRFFLFSAERDTEKHFKATR